MNISRTARVALAVSLLATTVTVVGRHLSGASLGTVIAITPDLLALEDADDFDGAMAVDLSGRAESGGVAGYASEAYLAVPLEFDDVDIEPAEDDGQAIGVSGDGCVFVILSDRFVVELDGSAVIVAVLDQCLAERREFVIDEPGISGDAAALAVSFDGAFAAVVYSQWDGEDETTSVRRVDTRTGATIELPDVSPVDPLLGIDIDDTGSQIVVPTGPPSAGIVSRWDVGPDAEDPGTVVPITPAVEGRWSAFPSISGDGAWVSFASDIPRQLGEVGTGPWVYVMRSGVSQGTLVSAPDAASYFSSLSRDGSQVAFSPAAAPPEPPPPTTTTTTTTLPPCDPCIEIVAASAVSDVALAAPVVLDAPQLLLDETPGVGSIPPCPNPLVDLYELWDDCPPIAVAVAYSAEPGLRNGLVTELVSLDAAGVPIGEHGSPALSGNGRWIAWIADADGYNALLDRDDEYGWFAVMRRRDPGLTVGDVDFPTVDADAVAFGAATVTNTGVTSVWLDEITPTPGGFTVVGGTCAVGASMPPGSSCTVDVAFAPAGSTDAVAGTLRVGEVAYDPVSALGALRATVHPTTTSTTTTTTIVGQNPTPPTTPPPTTQPPTTPPPVTPPPPTPPPVTPPPVTPPPPPPPPVVVLGADPPSIDFGPTPVGFESPARTVTITNRGDGSGTVTVTVGGADPDDFIVRANGCGALAASATCRFDVVMLPRDGGVRTGRITIRAGTAVTTVDLRGTGTFDPELVPSPVAVTERGIVVVFGLGFPPGDTFDVEVLDTDVVVRATADDQGVLRAPMAAAGQLGLGNYTVHVDGVTDVFPDVEASLSVVLPTFSPQGASGPAFGNGNIIVARGH